MSLLLKFFPVNWRQLPPWILFKRETARLAR